MTIDEIRTKVIEITAAELKISAAQVTSGAYFVQDLGADSMNTVELVIKYNEAFNIDIPADVVPMLSTVGHAIDYIGKHAS